MNQRLLIAAIVLGAVPSIAVVCSTLSAEAPTTRRLPEAKVVQPPPAMSRSPLAPRAPNPETARLEQRRVLFETVDGLLQAEEFERARRLLDDDQKQKRYGADSKPWRDLSQGYRLLADCLQHADARSRGRAELFLRTSEAPALDPKLRVACFEPRD